MYRVSLVMFISIFVVFFLGCMCYVILSVVCGCGGSLRFVENSLKLLIIMLCKLFSFVTV